MISVDFDFDKIAKKLDGITAASKEALRPAAQAGAEIFYIESKWRAPVSDEAHFFYGKNSKKTGVRYFFKSGNLRDSIYQYYNKRLSAPGKAVYSISWNHQKAPYGSMVEYGTSRAPAHPFLRPAYDAASERAKDAVLDVMRNSINEAIK
ncbi:phage protein, HK97 gp10 family [Polaromonas sp. OV174]|uniref:HK97-gp10 family putative phage morphogenesis protein n=1 Tax=Polaromonas sp. OV174 TaxID=1855300 RepID=UPI0008EC1499|nr:HK97-gp10 family putative phage morphogenesis protein [Polaromonas sp. OV174]SFB74160.1 phage protein, HK97 gp10 family [Polaromonas sp. OV174]